MLLTDLLTELLAKAALPGLEPREIPFESLSGALRGVQCELVRLLDEVPAKWRPLFELPAADRASDL
jgi:hypothetical protein